MHMGMSSGSQCAHHWRTLGTDCQYSTYRILVLMCVWQPAICSLVTCHLFFFRVPVDAGAHRMVLQLHLKQADRFM